MQYALFGWTEIHTNNKKICIHKIQVFCLTRMGYTLVLTLLALDRAIQQLIPIMYCAQQSMYAREFVPLQLNVH